MGANNYLVVRGSSGEVNYISFRYGAVREISYELGDKIDWTGTDRLVEASGLLYIPGSLYNHSKHISRHGKLTTPLDEDLFTYYKISIDNDILIGFSLIEFLEYDALEDDIYNMLNR